MQSSRKIIPATLRPTLTPKIIVFYLRLSLQQSPLPMDQYLSQTTVKISSYDNRGRILETIGPAGLVTQLHYDGTSGPLEGFLKETHYDPANLSIRTGYERDELGRVVRTYLPSHLNHKTEGLCLNQSTTILVKSWLLLQLLPSNSSQK